MLNGLKKRNMSEERIVKAPVRKWLVACVAPNTEKASRDRLLALGYEAFVASQEEVRLYKNGDRKKRKKVERVVITQYVFLHVTEQERRQVVELPYVKYFLLDRSYQDRTFATIPDHQMATLKQMLGQNDAPVQFTSSGFTLGDAVIVQGFGNFEYTGHVVRLRGDNHSFVGVRIEALGCAYLEIDPTNLSPLN